MRRAVHPIGLAWTALLLFVLGGREALTGLTRLLTAPTGDLLGVEAAALGRGLTEAHTGFLAGRPLLQLRGILHGLLLRRLQGLLDQAQHELPLGQLPARVGCLTLQVRLDPLEQVLLSAPSVNQYL